MSSAATAASRRSLNPEALLRPGMFDPKALLMLWLLRRSFWPLLFAGAIIAVRANRFNPDEISRVTSGPEEFLGALLSPLVGVVLAIGLRLVVAALSFLLAFPVSRDVLDSRNWIDRWYITQAVRSLRWTTEVRDLALGRVGGGGRKLGVAMAVLAVLGVVLGIAFVVVLGTIPPEALE